MKKIVMSILMVLSIFLTSCGNGSSSSQSLPPEAQTAVKEYWEALQKNQITGQLVPASQETFKITSAMKGKVPDDGFSDNKDIEIWCGSFSPTLYYWTGDGKQCTENSPCPGTSSGQMTYDWVTKNYVVRRVGQLWSVQVLKFQGVMEDEFLMYSCTNWTKEYDMSDHALNK